MKQANSLLGGAAVLATVVVSSSANAQPPQIMRVGEVREYSYRASPVPDNSATIRLADEHIVRFPKAAFLSLELRVELGEESVLTVTSLADGAVQAFTAKTFAQSGPFTCYFNGDAVRVRLWSGRGARRDTYRIVRVEVGHAQAAWPQTDFCDGRDDRVPSGDRRVARVLISDGKGTSICTGWLISPTNCLVTSGHCVSPKTVRITTQFNVPASTSKGVIRHPPPTSQYEWEGWTGLAYDNRGPGRDWAVYRSVANATTHRHAGQVQGSYFRFPTAPPTSASIRITGHGWDLTPPSRYAVQQTSHGSLTARTSTEYRTQADALHGNSGSPLVWNANGLALGVVTHCFCAIHSLRYNSATRYDVPAFAAARTRLCAELPDLRAESVTAPSTLYAGQLVRLTSRYSNFGSAVESTAAGYYLSTNSFISSSDTLLHGFQTRPLGSRAFALHGVQVRVPATVASGDCWIGLWIDPNRSVREKDEGNNIATSRVKCVALPDLKPASLRASQSVVWPGRVVQMQATIRNGGRAGSVGVTSGFYLSTNNAISTSDRLLRSFATRALSPQQTYAVSVPVSIPKGIANGKCWIGVYADILGRQLESLETNNGLGVAVTCSAFARLPDLWPTSLTVSTGVWNAGQLVGVNSTTKNQGTADVASFESAYYLSTDAVITTADTLLATFATGSLKAGLSHRHATTVRIPRSVASGPCWLGLYVDPQARVEELVETNNTLARSGTCVGLAELVIESLKIRQSPPFTAGDAIDIVASTRNRGAATAVSSTTAIVLSTDDRITARDVLLTSHATGALQPGVARTATLRCRLPYYTRSGPCWVGAIADVAGDVPELSESNNTASVQAACRHYEGPTRAVEWQEARFPNDASRVAFVATEGGKATIALTMPERASWTYVLLWSGREEFVRDALTDVSVSLLNTPIFSRWAGVLDESGRAQASLALPRVPGLRLDVYTHVLLLDPKSRRKSEFADLAIEARVR